MHIFLLLCRIFSNFTVTFDSAVKIGLCVRLVRDGTVLANPLVLDLART